MKPEPPAPPNRASPDLANRCCWTDKFNPPTPEDLLRDLAEQRAAVEEVRSLLLSDARVKETVSWEGVAWRWCFVYARPGDGTRAWAYLIPDPSGARLCVPLPAEAVEQIRMRRLKKATRDAILHGQAVNGVRWPCVAVSAPPAEPVSGGAGVEDGEGAGGRRGGGPAGGGAAAGASLEEIREILRVKEACSGEATEGPGDGNAAGG